MEKGEKITKKERKTTGEMWLAGGVWEDIKKDWSNVAYFDVKCLMKKYAFKIKSNYLNHSKLHMLTACRCLKSPRSISLKPPSHRTATMATKVIHQITVWSPDIRKTLLCMIAIGTVLRSHGSLTHDLCEPNCVSTTTSASVRRSYHDLTPPWTRVQCDHRRPYSDVTMT